jgi:hypothetical protein
MSIRDHITARRVFTLALLVEIGIMLALSLGAISVENPATANNTLLSVILGTVSAYLLYSQVDIQRNQVSIEEKLLKYETEPSLVVVDRWFERDDLYLDVANYGHGIAEDLRVECIVECQVIPRVIRVRSLLGDGIERNLLIRLVSPQNPLVAILELSWNAIVLRCTFIATCGKIIHRSNLSCRVDI